MTAYFSVNSKFIMLTKKMSKSARAAIEQVQNYGWYSVQSLVIKVSEYILLFISISLQKLIR